MEKWGQRTHHFLRLNKNLIAPLVLFLPNPTDFTSDVFEKIIKVLHDFIPKDLVIDPSTQNFSVSTINTPEKPLVYNSKEVKFCYYWTQNMADYSICVSKEANDTKSGLKDTSISKKSDRRTPTLLFEKFRVTDMQINVCILDDETLTNDSSSIQHHISQFFEPVDKNPKKKNRTKQK